MQAGKSSKASAPDPASAHSAVSASRGAHVFFTRFWPLVLLALSAAVVLMFSAIFYRMSANYMKSGNTGLGSLFGIGETPPADLFDHGTGDISEKQLTAIVGSWKGSDGSGMTFYENGTAVYASEHSEYSEVDCPWTCRGGRLWVQLAKMHCVISSPVEEGSAALSFSSDSKNWGVESFEKLSYDEPLYLVSALSNYDTGLTTDMTGRMHVSFDGLEMTIPKHFTDIPNSADKNPDSLVLADTDVDKKFTGGIGMSYRDYPDLDLLGEYFEGGAMYFVTGFIDDAELEDIRAITVAGIPAFTARFRGKYLRSFGMHAGVKCSGIVTFVCNYQNGKVLQIFMSQTRDGYYDLSGEFEEILTGAVLEEAQRSKWLGE